MHILFTTQLACEVPTYFCIITLQVVNVKIKLFKI